MSDGASPPTATSRGGFPTSSTVPGVVACVAYAGGRRVGEVPLGAIDEALQREDAFVWIGLYEPDEELLGTVQRQFGLHDLAIEDAHRAHQRPKLEQYHDSLFVVMRTAQLGQDAAGSRRLEFGETHVFVGSRYLVTVRHGSHRSHVELRSRCGRRRRCWRRGRATCCTR
jgi:magnesium transporter